MSDLNLPKLTRTRVKICGMTRSDDVRAAVALGVDAIGMILHADSPRTISVDQARTIRAEVPALVSLVGVFVDCSIETINEYAKSIGLDLVQLHGAENNEFGQALDTPFIKAIRARENTQVAHAVAQYPDARALLLDPYVKGQHGGTGTQLSASLWPKTASKPLILAGGLSADNVVHAVKQLTPFAVDLNSGVETSPGVKDAQKMARAIVSLSAS